MAAGLNSLESAAGARVQKGDLHPVNISDMYLEHSKTDQQQVQVAGVPEMNHFTGHDSPCSTPSYAMPDLQLLYQPLPLSSASWLLVEIILPLHPHILCCIDPQPVRHNFLPPSI